MAHTDGDVELALELLAGMEGLGEYQDQVHRRAELRGPRRSAPPGVFCAPGGVGPIARLIPGMARNGPDIERLSPIVEEEDR
jgi:hypothetical protein